MWRHRVRKSAKQAGLRITTVMAAALLAVALVAQTSVPRHAEASVGPNIASQAIVLLTSVTNPLGISSHDLNVMRDGFSGPSAFQYDTWDGNNAAVGEDYYGYAWVTPQQIARVMFTEGSVFPDGGFFTTLRLETSPDGVTWTTIAGGNDASPPYPNANDGIPFSTYQWDFIPAITARYLRVIGIAGGTAEFTSVSEFQVFTSGGVVPVDNIAPFADFVGTNAATPTGNGASDLNVIRDGIKPPVGSFNPSLQYDTNTGAPNPAEVYFLYRWPSQRTITRIELYGGQETAAGGWWTNLRIELSSNGNDWNVMKTAADAVPVYPNAASQSFNHYTFAFATPRSGKYMRIIGPSGGAPGYISAAEIEVYAELEPGEGGYYPNIAPSAAEIFGSHNAGVSQGSPTLTVINDGYAPGVDAVEPLAQFDTWNGLNAATGPDFYAYRFATTKIFTAAAYTEGMQFTDGGWFAGGPQIEVSNDGATWTPVPGTIAPVYVDDDGHNFNRYAFTFTAPATGRYIRLVGVAGGESEFTSVAEFEVYGGDLTATNSVDLRLAKSVSNPTPNVGDTVTFTVTLSSHNSTTATGVTVADALPAGVTLVSATPSTGTYAAGVWSVPTLLGNSTATLALTVTVNAGTETQTITNTASISSANQVNTGTPTTAAASITVGGTLGVPNVIITLTVDNPSPPVGTNITITITAKNIGTAGATGVSVPWTLPSGLILVSTTPNTGSPWAVGSLAVNEEKTLVIVATVNGAPGQPLVVNAGPVTCDQPCGTGTGSVTITPAGPLGDPNIAPLADLLITSVPAPLGGGNHDLEIIRDLSYPVPGTNDAGAQYDTWDAAAPTPAIEYFGYRWPNRYHFTGAKFVDGMHFADGGYFSAPPTVEVSEDGVTWTAVATVTGYLGNAAPNFTAYPVNFVADGRYLRLAGTPGGSAEFTSIAELEVYGVILPGAPVVNITVTVDNPAPPVGTNVTITITATNVGTAGATGVSVPWTLPSGLTLVSTTPSSGTPWNVGSLAVAEVKTLVIVATVNGTPGQPLVVNAGPVTCDQPCGTGTGSVTITPAGLLGDPNIAPLANLLITSVPAPLGGGNHDLEIIRDLSYPVPGTNNPALQYDTFDFFAPTGPDYFGYRWPNRYHFTGAKFVDGMHFGDGGYFSAPPTVEVSEDGVTWTAVATVTGYLGNAAPNFTAYNIPFVADGRYLRIIGTPAGAAEFTSIAELEVYGTVLPGSPDVNVTVTGIPANPLPGGTVTITVTATNVGDAGATGVVIGSPVPSGLTLVSATPSQGTYTGGVWTLGGLPAGDSQTLVLIVTVDAGTGGQTITHTATITQMTEPNPGTGTGSATLHVGIPGAPIVNITVTVDNPAPLVGQNVTITITATNVGTAGATGVSVPWALPPGLTLVSTTPSSGSPWAAGSLAVGEVKTLVVVATVTGTPGQPLVVTAGPLTMDQPNTGTGSGSVTITPAANVGCDDDDDDDEDGNGRSSHRHAHSDDDDCDDAGQDRGWMNVGGNIGSGSWKYTWGGAISCDGIAKKSFEYQDHRTGVQFKLRTVTTVTCSTIAGVSQGQPRAGFNTLVLAGTSSDGKRVEAMFIDAGEPGRNDWVNIRVFDAGGTQISSVSGTLGGGNLQAHKGSSGED